MGPTLVLTSATANSGLPQLSSILEMTTPSSALPDQTTFTSGCSSWNGLTKTFCSIAPQEPAVPSITRLVGPAARPRPSPLPGGISTDTPPAPPTTSLPVSSAHLLGYPQLDTGYLPPDPT